MKNLDQIKEYQFYFHFVQQFLEKLLYNFDYFYLVSKMKHGLSQ